MRKIAPKFSAPLALKLLVGLRSEKVWGACKNVTDMPYLHAQFGDDRQLQGDGDGKVRRFFSVCMSFGLSYASELTA